ncbi:MAG: zincin-like metallopeptidase domain-containing protein [Acidobacteria bacterium]|nr:zincin-like metallopeptidase domain-containing protein [Acidobacteriota bacterium]
MRDTEVSIGGRRMVALRESVLIPADLEITATAGEHYRDVSQFLARRVEQGQAPWTIRRAESYALPEDLSGRPYQGPAAVWLAAVADRHGYSDPRWGTREGVEEEGGRVRAGEEPASALHWRFAGADPRTGERWGTRVFRFPVYNAEQCEGLPALDRGGTTWYHHPSPSRILAVPEIEVSGTGAARYDLGRDRIELPAPEAFGDRQAYYRTAIHEVGHWTGHPSRLDRPTLAAGIGQGLGSREYAREELRAELHSYLTGARLGIGHDPERHARFGAEWAQALRADPREVYRAAHSAERISRYVTARRPEMKPSRPESSGGRVEERAHPVPEPERGR